MKERRIVLEERRLEEATAARKDELEMCRMTISPQIVMADALTAHSNNLRKPRVSFNLLP